jgi:hypothetical protein
LTRESLRKTYRFEAWSTQKLGLALVGIIHVIKWNLNGYVSTLGLCSGEGGGDFSNLPPFQISEDDVTDYFLHFSYTKLKIPSLKLNVLD